MTATDNPVIIGYVMWTEKEKLNREANRIAALLTAAEDRLGEAWDKPAHIQDRIERTIAKHRRTLAQLEARIEARR